MSASSTARSSSASSRPADWQGRCGSTTVVCSVTRRSELGELFADEPHLLAVVLVGGEATHLLSYRPNAPAEEAPTIGRVRETRPRGRPGADDWLGDVSDDDWDENAAARSEPRGATSAYDGADAAWPEPTTDVAPAERPPVADARRAAVERRRIVAGGLVVALLGVAAAVLVVLLRDGGSEPVTSATTPTTVTTPAPTESTPSTTTTTPSSTTPETTPEPGATTFTLPEGTKLRRGEENDAAVVTALQQALTTAGFDPGPADGVYGQGTEAAVVAFQEANDLAADGVVGPDTAAALTNALATG